MSAARTIPAWAKDLGGGKTPPVLLPYQKRWVADQAAVKVCEKSRRVGLSWAEASDDALHAASASGDDVWYIGYNLDMAREFINDCAGWARHYHRAAVEIEEVALSDEDRDILSLRITFASGHRITALSSRPTNLRGKQGRVVIDEAAFHDDLDGLLKAALALLMWGGQVRVISTHNGDSNPFNELIGEIRAGKRPYSLHRITLDDALAEGLYKRICLVLGRDWTPAAETAWREELVRFYGDAADEELFCIPRQGSGVYLTRAVLERVMRPEIPVLRWSVPDAFAVQSEEVRRAEARDWCEEHLAPLLANLPATIRHYLGEDFGRSGDLTVLAPLAEGADLVFRPPFLVELRNVPFREQEAVLFYLLDRLPRFSGAAMDGRGNGQYLAEVAVQRYGIGRVNPVMLSVEWYREHMPRLKAALEDQTLLLPRNADVLNDLRAVRMEKGVAKVPDTLRTRGTDGGQRHGDSAIALALGLFAAHACVGGEMEYTPVSTRRFGEAKSAY